MNIKPNYQYNHNCHFCKANKAMPGAEELRDCYYFESATHMTGVYHKLGYKKISVYIPKCIDCSNISSRINRVKLSVNWIILFCMVAINLYLFSGDNAPREWYIKALAIVGIALLATLIISRLTSFVIEILMEKKLNYDSYTDDYLPIKRLRDLGFTPRDTAPSAKSTIQGKGAIDLSNLNRVLTEIRESDHCVIE